MSLVAIFAALTCGLIGLSSLVSAQTPGSGDAFVATTFMGLPTNSVEFSDFSGATLDGQGRLWTVDNSTAQVVAYRNVGDTWLVIRSFSIANIGGVPLSDPESITWLDGNRFAVIDETTNHLHYLDFAKSVPTRERLVPLGDKIPVVTRNRGIEGLTYDHDASGTSLDVFYVGVEEPATLYRVDVGRSFTVTSMPLPIPEIAGLEKVPGTNELFIISEADNTIYRTTTRGAKPVRIGSASQFAQPEGIALAPNGLLYVVGESGTYQREFGIFRPSNPTERRVAVIQSETTTSNYQLESRASDAQEANGKLSDHTRSLELNATTKIGLRLQNVCVEDTETIVDARLKLIAAKTSSLRTVATVRADMSGQPAHFTDALLTGRKVTNAARRWVMPSTFAGEKITSPNIGAVLAEVTSAPNWPGCGDIVIILQGTGDRAFRSFDAAESLSAMLDVKTINVPKSWGETPDAAPIGSSLRATLGEAAFVPSSPDTATAGQWAGFVIQPDEDVATSPSSDDPVVEATTTTIESDITDGELDRERMGERDYFTSTDLDLSTGIEVTLSYDICVPAGATIDHAAIGFVASRDHAAPTHSVITVGLGHAGSPTTVHWDIGEWAQDAFDTTPDLSEALQATLASADRSGCATVDFGFTSHGRREAFSFEGAPSKAPHLVISFSQ